MPVRVIYAATYEFETPALDLRLRCRLRPLPRPGVHVRSARVEAFPEPAGWSQTVEAGKNLCDHAIFATPVSRLQVSADLQIGIEQTSRLPSARPAKADLRTEHNDFVKAGRCSRAEIQALIERLSYDWIYDDTAWNPSITIAQLVHRGQGACEDFARVCVEALRRVGVPARFIVGYLAPAEPALRQPRRRHAWFACWTHDCGWTEFDPLNESAPAPVVATAWGPVLPDLQPIEGSFSQGHLSRVAVDVHVLAGPADGA